MSEILVIAPEDRLRSALERRLSAEGMNPVCAGTGTEALSLLNAPRFDAILLHWQLPDMDGMAVLHELRTRTLDTPVMLLSSRTSVAECAQLKGVNIHVHCFTGTREFAEHLLSLDANIFIGFTGIITFKNAANVREAAEIVPDGRLLLETDAPYMAPVPYRGKPCHSGYIPYIAKTLAETRNKPVEEIYRLCRENTRRCYGI